MHGEYDQIKYHNIQNEIDTMQQMTLLHKAFEKSFPSIHKTRLSCLINTCNIAATHNTLFLTGLGRKDPAKTKTSSNIEKINRLLGNKHLYLERIGFYQSMAARLIPKGMSPWIHVDWSCINATTNLYVLRASISAKGRSIVIWEESHPKKKENNHTVHKQFLKNLKRILPACRPPVIVTDAGFRGPWFIAVRQMGWEFVGRLRNKNLIQMEGMKTWKLSATLFPQATGKPTYLGQAHLTEQKKIPVNLVLYKGKSKNRHKHNLNKKISASGKSKRYSKAAKEPWILVTSLPQSRDNPNEIVNIYRQRMRIEENFRDTKCSHYGLGLKHSLTRTSERMAILLLIAAIATFAAWLAGIITTLTGKASDFQAHSAKFTRSLSLVYLGREAIKKQLVISEWLLFDAFNHLLQLIIQTQLEQGVYE